MHMTALHYSARCQLLLGLLAFLGLRSLPRCSHEWPHSGEVIASFRRSRHRLHESACASGAAGRAWASRSSSVA